MRRRIATLYARNCLRLIPQLESKACEYRPATECNVMHHVPDPRDTVTFDSDGLRPGSSGRDDSVSSAAADAVAIGALPPGWSASSPSSTWSSSDSDTSTIGPKSGSPPPLVSPTKDELDPDILSPEADDETEEKLPELARGRRDAGSTGLSTLNGFKQMSVGTISCMRLKSITLRMLSFAPSE